MSSNNILTSALQYQQRSWPIVPIYTASNGICTCSKRTNCSSAGKHPKTSNGLKGATLDENEIRRFCQSPINIGILTGSKSGLCILDVDPQSGGNESLEALIKEFGPFPETPIAITGNAEGRHFYFKYPISQMKNKVGFRKGLDIRAEGGYIIAPPSLHKSGKNYRWADGKSPDDIEIAEMPEWLLKLLSEPRHKNSASSKILEGERNTSLFKISCRLRKKGISSFSILEQLAEINRLTCVPPLSIDEIEKIVQSSEGYNHQNQALKEWNIPLQLPTFEQDTPTLDKELIPEPLRDWVEDVSIRMQTPYEMIAAPAIVVFSSMIGRKLTIRPKQFDDWTITPNLWGAIIAPPSAKKTPSIKSVLKSIVSLDEQSRLDFEERVLDYEQTISKLCDEDKKPDRPIRKRRIIYDSTIEKIAIILKENPNGLLVYRDELYGFLSTFLKQGRESDRQFYLESFNGNGHFTSDRIGRDTVDTPALCLSILGGIQPDKMAEYFESSIKYGSSDDGFLSRFQMLVYPTPLKTWTLIDREPNKKAEKKVQDLFKSLDELDFLKIGLPSEEGVPYSRFSLEAQAIFNNWIINLENRLISGEIETPALEAHLAKYPKLMPSLALIFQMIDFLDASFNKNNISKINAKNAQLAIDWCSYLECHIRKIYAHSQSKCLSVAKELIKRIDSKDIYDGISIRSIYRKEWSGLRTAHSVKEGLYLLESLHWIQILEGNRSGIGASSETIFINPAIINGSAFTKR